MYAYRCDPPLAHSSSRPRGRGEGRRRLRPHGVSGAERVRAGERRQAQAGPARDPGAGIPPQRRGACPGDRQTLDHQRADQRHHQVRYASAIRGIEEAARAVGLVVALTLLDGDDEESARVAVDLALGQPLAGVIVLEFDIQGGRALAALPETIPAAAVSSAGQGRSIPRALFDDHAGARDATNYLLGLGHRTVHHVGIPASGRPSGRLLGWREALEAAGAPVPEIVESDETPGSGLQAGAYLARRGDVTAVLCGNDEVAFGVIRAFQDEGLRVPEDVSVVGFDDHPLAEIWTPSLTTMRQDFAELGRMAVDFLLGRLAGVPVEATHSTPRLVIRESAAPPAR